ncbi:PGF-CTERM sorting domain-containing protein [Natrialbaceae archaeon AArc-T1-2]|uniref:PGF-CTERM sorting domain-containing protein n=1 Tax=Natrialbaceae archaeon AArc-T1-2 TaxID=3053904 RepID=UPI00255ADA1D|nr:PGF-CTERM sorting domain-containing protein [Natrialbaceae archaeon AArc-T1-2]WIV66306.1 PGF-CTERM sorting domain-containing protein [Natrialbaceae archaeon AArc-T1-2]
MLDQPLTARIPTAIALGVLVCGLVTAVAVAGVVLAGPPPTDDSTTVGTHSSDASVVFQTEREDQSEEPIEPEYVEPVPEEDDPYYEAAARDGSWVSYVNPRDEYRDPYLGDGSGKLCVTLLNEDGDVIVGESVPNTTVTVPTGDSLAWHTSADPFTVEYPLTDHHVRPLDADQFGTTPDLPQGDGYMDSHCIEWHGLPEDETVSYGEVEIDGEYEEYIDVVGYHQQAHDSWDSDVDPIEDAVSYEEAGGGWTYRTDGSHGQAVVVLQLDPPTDASDDAGTDDDAGDDDTADGEDDERADHDVATGTASTDDTSPDAGDDEVPGLGVLAALVALAVALVCARR